MDDLRERLHRLVDDLPVGPPPISQMTSPLRPRGWLAPVAAAAAVLVAVGATWGVVLQSDAPRHDLTTPGASTPVPADWQRLPDPPLSPRTGALGFDVDGKVLVLGGSDATFAGGPFRTPELRDGAVLDLSTKTWRTVSRAPWAPASASTSVVVGDRVVLAHNGSPGAWLLYDLSEDRWRKVPPPPEVLQQPTMAAVGDRVYAIDKYVVEGNAPVQVLDLSTMRWSRLPASPHRPEIDDRALVATDHGLVMMGADVYPPRAGKGREPAVAEIWDGHSWRRYSSSHAAGMEWHWTGRRVISAYRLTRRDAKPDRPDAFLASAFDPATGRWQQLPWLPAPQRGLLETGWSALRGPLVLNNGYLYDDRTGASTPVRRPSPFGAGTTQVLTDHALVVVGGARAKPGTAIAPRVGALELTNRAWLLSLGK